MRQNIKNVSPMSNEGRNVYVIEHLTCAFFTLLRDKPMDAISVSELCSHAGVSRASFYRNFNCKEDIIRLYIDGLFSEWMDEYAEGNGKPISALIRSLFSHFEKHREFYRLLNEKELIYLLKDAIIRICGPKPEQPKSEAYAKAFVAYSLYGWIEVWFQRGMKESPEEMEGLFKIQGLNSKGGMVS